MEVRGFGGPREENRWRVNIKTDNICFFLPAEIYELTQSFRSLIFDDRSRVTYPGTVKKVSFLVFEDTYVTVRGLDSLQV